MTARKSLKKIVEMCRKNNFLELQVKNELTIKIAEFLPLSTRLMSNIKNEYKSSKDSKIPCYLKFSKDSNISDPNNLDYLNDPLFVAFFSQYKANPLPFAICEELNRDASIMIQNNYDSESINIESQNGVFLRTTYFINEHFSSSIFSEIQRQHKIWWMKYSASPGRFQISDQKTLELDGVSIKSVNITSTIDSKMLMLEKLQLLPAKDLLTAENRILYRTKNESKKTVTPGIVQSTIFLDTAAIGVLFDAIESSEDHGVCLHRRLAPYQVCLLIAEKYTDPQTNEDLQNLARYVELLLQKKSKLIAVLNNPETTGEIDLELQLMLLDEVGTPYTIILDKASLHTGLLQLRNRNTTLNETVHISYLDAYLLKMFDILDR